MKRNKTMRTILLDYVAANGPQTWSELHRVVLTVAGRNLNEKHWGIGYLDNVSSASLPGMRVVTCVRWEESIT